MSTVDLFFLAGVTLALAVWVAFDRFTRALLWDTLRHPFTASRIEESEDGVVRVTHLSAKSEKREPTKEKH